MQFIYLSILRFSTFFCFLLLLSCQAKENSNQNKTDVKNPDLATQLVGEWRNVSMSVEIQGDSLTVFEANEKNWEEKLRIKVIQTFFRPDKTYNSPHYTLSDSLFLDLKGTWAIDGDNLTMYQELPAKDTTVCKLSIKDGLAHFDCMVDWDSDGRKDDQYLGVQRKVVQ